MTKRDTSQREGIKSLGLPFLLFLIASLLLYGSLIPMLSWKVFSEDDSHIMRVAIDYGWLEHYFVPNVYRQYSVANYTPISLTAYRFMLTAFGLNPIAYLVFSAVAVSVVSALAGLLTDQITRSRTAAWQVVLLIFSSLSMLTLIGRFYTIHYIAGGLCALLALVLIVRGGRALPALLIFFALICKEVYVVLPVLVVLHALYRRDYKLALGVMTATFMYLLLRTYILGLSFNVGAGNSYFAGFWVATAADWQHFIIWYAKTRYLILTGVMVALIMSPTRMLSLLPIALLFALPSLSVSHGILQPELHADRLFFALDIGLVIISALALQQSEIVRRHFKSVHLLPIAAIALMMHGASHGEYRESSESGADYWITRYILENRESLQSKTIYVPLEFTQGELMRVSAGLGEAEFFLTQNCRMALELPETELLVFDRLGGLSDRSALEQSCVAVDTVVDVEIPPRFSNGILEWRVQASEGFTAGILFVDRAFAVPASEFARQLVMPAPGERYQIFAVKDNEWWFSDIEAVEIVD